MAFEIPPAYQKAVEVVDAARCRCQYCGHRWLPDQDKAAQGLYPKTCPNKGCKKAHWERGYINPEQAERMRQWYADGRPPSQRTVARKALEQTTE